MFILTPIIIFLIAVGAIIYIVSRKLVYLKKLTPEIVSGSSQGSFLEEFLPEIYQKVRKIKFREYKMNFLADFEKLLRRIRLISMRFDMLTNKLIHKVRRTTTRAEVIVKAPSSVEMKPKIQAMPENNLRLREEEQRLIIEIAKTPKDAKLYKELGGIYLKTGEKEDAIESLKKAVELDAEDKDSRKLLDELLARDIK